MKEINLCPSCESNSLKHYLVVKDHSTSKENFKIVSCETCGLKLTSPRPSEEEVYKYYNNKNYISHTNNKKGLINNVYQIVRKHTIRKKIKLICSVSSKKTILDFGCGTGEFLNACRKSGFKCFGVEPSDSARKKAEKNYNLKIIRDDSLKEIKDCSIGVVTMWHVLEHVSSLNKTLREMSRIIAKEGSLVVAVPNNLSFDAKHYKGFWAAWDVPIHFWHFTQPSIKSLMKKHGFVLSSIRGMPFDSFYISILSEQYKTGRLNLLKSIIIGLVSNIKAILNKKNYSSITYVFKRN